MKILHLYHDLMNLYGEYGNVVVLKKHLEDQGIKVILDKKSVGEAIKFEDYDFIYCGSGTEKNQEVALKDLLRYQDDLKKAILNNVVVLFTGNAMELLGKTIGDKKALDIIAISTTLTNDRYTGDVVVLNDELGEIVGFINKCSIIKGNKEDALFSYVFKDSNLKDNEYEGYHLNNLFGTHIIGPILVKNPNFMKKIVTLLLEKEKKYDYKEISYPYEKDSYEVTLKALKDRSK